MTEATQCTDAVPDIDKLYNVFSKHFHALHRKTCVVQVFDAVASSFSRALNALRAAGLIVTGGNDDSGIRRDEVSVDSISLSLPVQVLRYEGTAGAWSYIVDCPTQLICTWIFIC